jgi:ABC-type cobalamin transport system ATPase subunit
LLSSYLHDCLHVLVLISVKCCCLRSHLVGMVLQHQSKILLFDDGKLVVQRRTGRQDVVVVVINAQIFQTTTNRRVVVRRVCHVADTE